MIKMATDPISQIYEPIKTKEYRCTQCDFKEIIEDGTVLIYQRCPKCNEGHIYLYKVDGELQIPKKSINQND